MSNINKKNTKLSSLSTNSNSVGKNINNKLSSSNEKIKNNSNVNNNKASLGHSNSQLNVNSNKLTTKNKKNINKIKTNNSQKKSIIINSDLMDIDNIDESAYNPEPFVPPKKQFDHNLYISKIENTINNYNEIKVDLNKKILDTKLPNNAKNLQLRNFSLLEQLDKLNAILDTMVERKRFTKQKKNLDSSQNKKISKSQEIRISSKEINYKLLNSFEKQYSDLSEKYQKISQDNYVQNLKKEVKTITDEITNMEKINRELKTLQFKAEYSLKNNNYSQNDLNYKKNLTQYERLDNEYTKLMKKIPIIEELIQNNEIKINQLNDNKNDLITIAKEMYNINNPEEIINKKMFNKEREKNNLKLRELKRKALEGETYNKKYNNKKKENGKHIKQLEDNKIMVNSILNDKNELLEQLNKKLNELELECINMNNNNNNHNNNNNNNELNQNKISYKKLNLINDKNNSSKKENMVIFNDNNNNKISSLENQSMISPIKPTDNNINNSIEINDNKIENMMTDIKDYNSSHQKTDSAKKNNRYNAGETPNLNNNNNQTYNKKMVLQQLDIQKNQENLINTDKSINIKKNKFKPNFSFSLNDANLKDKKVNLSVALKPKTTMGIEEKNESEGEIKEDIQVNNNNDEKEKNNLENKYENQKINTNLSQNISMEKIDKIEENSNEKENNRENDLNTIPYDDEIDNEGKKINNDINNDNNNENNDNYNITNSNEQEHIFEKGQINIQDNREDNIIMD